MAIWLWPNSLVTAALPALFALMAILVASAFAAAPARGRHLGFDVTMRSRLALFVKRVCFFVVIRNGSALIGRPMAAGLNGIWSRSDDLLRAGE